MAPYFSKCEGFGKRAVGSTKTIQGIMDISYENTLAKQLLSRMFWQAGGRRNIEML